MTIIIIIYLWLIGAVPLYRSSLEEEQEIELLDWIIIALWPMLIPVVMLWERKDEKK